MTLGPLSTIYLRVSVLINNIGYVKVFLEGISWYLSGFINFPRHKHYFLLQIDNHALYLASLILVCLIMLGISLNVKFEYLLQAADVINVTDKNILVIGTQDP